MKAGDGVGFVTSPEGVEVLERALDFRGIGGANYGLLLRDSRVLCALPPDRETALRTLALYQPQRRAAVLLRKGFRMAACFGCHRFFLKKWRRGTPDGALPGVMIGSAGHLCERAVLVEKRDGGWQVVKLAFGELGDGILGAEAAMLESLAGRPWVPRLLHYEVGAEAAELAMEWQDGDAWTTPDLAPLNGLLREWRGGDGELALKDFAEWAWIGPVLERSDAWRERVDGVAEWTFRPGIRHGDLTRPNLRMGPDGKLRVHDWERGTMAGLPGVDLVHFLVQDEFFRTRKTPMQVMQAVMGKLEEPMWRDALACWGWGGRKRALMAVAFALNTGARYMDQAPLIEALEKVNEP